MNLKLGIGIWYWYWYKVKVSVFGICVGINLWYLVLAYVLNTSLAARAHRLQHLTGHLIQNDRWGLEIGQTLDY